MSGGRRRFVPSALTLVTVFLILSGAGRLAMIGAATAQAQTATSPASDAAPSLALQAIAPTLSALLKEAEERHAQLDLRERKLDDIEAKLVQSRAQIEIDLARLTEAEKALRDRIALADTAAEDDVARLTNVYENMAPDVAASLFALMEPQFAAGFLGRMRPDAAAAILAGLDTDKAYAISVVLAGRNVGLVPGSGPAE